VLGHDLMAAMAFLRPLGGLPKHELAVAAAACGAPQHLMRALVALAAAAMVPKLQTHQPPQALLV
jgi:hypothetical protein